MARTLVWDPPEERAPSIEFRGDRGPFAITDDALRGLDATGITPVTRRSPGQVGGTAVNVEIPARVISLKAGLIAADEAALDVLRETLISSLAMSPARVGETVDLGLLTYTRADGTSFEIPAIPRLGPSEAAIGPSRDFGQWDVEWLCPDGRWRALTDQVFDFEPAPGAGFEFPLEHPWESPYSGSQATVENVGQLAAPIVVQFHGEMTAPTLTLEETGESIIVAETVEPGEYVEVSTAPGNRYVELVDAAGNRDTVIERWDIENGIFWQLPPGVSTVTFAPSSTVDGVVIANYRPLYAGA